MKQEQFCKVFIEHYNDGLVPIQIPRQNCGAGPIQPLRDREL